MRRMKRYKIILSLLVLFLVGLGSGVRVNAEPESETTKPKTETTNPNTETKTLGQDSTSPVTMEYSYGYDSYGKYGRQIPIFASLQNKSDTQFHGWLEVTIPLVEDGRVYRKEVILEPGESKSLSMTIPLSGGFGQIDIRLVDKNNNALLESTNPIKVGNYEKLLFAGVLTDTPETIEYMDNIAIKSFVFNEESFPTDVSYLESLDIIIINNFDTSKLQDDQIRAIKQWILHGGSLVIGTGENVLKVAGPLAQNPMADEFGIVVGEETGQENDIVLSEEAQTEYIEGLRSQILRFEEERNLLRGQVIERNRDLDRYNNPLIPLEDILGEEWPSEYLDDYTSEPVNIIKNFANVSFDEADNKDKGDVYSLEIKSEDGEEAGEEVPAVSIYNKKALGQGNILLYNFDLGQDEADDAGSQANWSTMIVFSIIGNLSYTKQTQLDNELNGNYMPYSISSSMSYTDTENIPKVGPYIIILIVYILLIGPIAYTLLKKKDKQGLIWIIVPVTAVIFTGIMYIAGSKTRVDEPFVGYVELQMYGDNDIVEDELYFSLTAPYNDKYTVKLPPQYEDVKLISDSYEFPMDNKHRTSIDSDKYTAAVNYGLDQTTLEINNNPAFTPVYYKTTSDSIGSNPLEADIHYTGDKLEGTITNNSNYTITDGIYIGDTFLFNIGTIGKGQTIDIKDMEKLNIYDINDIYDVEVINPESTATADTNRKRDILYYLIDKLSAEGNYDTSHGGCIIGFTEDGTRSPFIEEVSKELEVYGSKAIMAQVNVDYYKEGAQLVPSIESLVRNEDISSPWEREGYEYGNDYSYYIAEEETMIEYYFPANEEILSVEYYALSNQKPLSQYNTEYIGKIYALNRKTGEFDRIYTSNTSENKDTTLISPERIDDYIRDDKVLTLRYEPSLGITRTQDTTMLLPKISYWKEAN